MEIRIDVYADTTRIGQRIVYVKPEHYEDAEAAFVAWAEAEFPDEVITFDDVEKLPTVYKEAFMAGFNAGDQS